MDQNHNAIVALTDYDWYVCLNQLSNIDMVNFWTPTPWNIRKLKKDDFVFFLLKEAFGRKICGYGEFVKYETSFVSDAWNKYGKQNGVESLTEFTDRIQKYTEKNSKDGFRGTDHLIGCMILKDLVLFDNIHQKKPELYGWDIPKQVVKFKYIYSINNFTTDEKKYNFKLVQNKIKHRTSLQKERIGQSKFRKNIMATYNKKCCITSETMTEVLEAAHIQEYISEESNHTQNGLLLRTDFHKLFDAGLISIDKNYKVKISHFITSENYKKIDGLPIYLPKEKNNRPSVEALQWHLTNIFRP